MTLTIGPGVVVKFAPVNNPSLDVRGSLDIEGSEMDPAVFTAFADDDYGGDMKGDGACNSSDASSTAACPLPGAWGNTYIEPSSTHSVFNHAIVRYGGRWFTNILNRALVVVDHVTVPFRSVTVDHAAKNGIQIVDAPIDISDSRFSNNATDVGSCGVRADNGSGMVARTVFERNSHGMCFTQGTLTIESSSFANHSGPAIDISWATTTVSNSLFSGNHPDISANSPYVFSCIGDSCGTLATIPNPL